MPELKDIEKAGHLVAAVRKSQASYADFRAVRITTEDIALTNGKVDKIDRKVSFGFGVRALVDGAWGFAAAPGCDERSAKAILADAMAIAHASGRLIKEPATLAPVAAVKADYKTPVQVDPFAVPLKEKVEFLQHLDALLRETEGINQTETFLGFRREEKWFYSSEGAVITQTILHSGGGLSAAAMKSRREVGERSFPTSGGQHQAGGYEIITGLNFEAGCKPTAQEAVALLSAPVLPQQTTALILSGDLVSLQIHESIGHPLELDRVFGYERNFSGTSFATPEQRNELQYAAPLVTVTADPTAPDGLGTFGFDDEGVPARPVVLIKDGVLVDYLSSRETAARLQIASSGAMRAETWGDLPLVRMTNTNLTPGSGTLDDLIADTEQGVLIATPATWSIDDRREKFQLGGEIAWEIKDGTRGHIYKNPVYSGTTVDFWRSCDRICGPEAYTIWGTPSCGKGQPGQNMRTGQGAAPARFRDVKVGQAA